MPTRNEERIRLPYENRPNNNKLIRVLREPALCFLDDGNGGHDYEDDDDNSPEQHHNSKEVVDETSQILEPSLHAEDPRGERKWEKDGGEEGKLLNASSLVYVSGQLEKLEVMFKTIREFL
ncbi:hypothetical protein Neosp_010065 [[Neocosmospora] mangrovei]